MIGEYQMLNDVGSQGIGYYNGLCKHSNVKLYEPPNDGLLGVCLVCAAVVCIDPAKSDPKLESAFKHSGRAGYGNK